MASKRRKKREKRGPAGAKDETLPSVVASADEDNRSRSDDDKDDRSRSDDDKDDRAGS